MLEVIRTVASLGAFASVVLAIFVYIREQKRRTEDEIYRRLGLEWTEFLKVAIEHPELDPMNTAIVLGRTTVSPEENKRIALQFFTATTMGRAWRVYRSQPTSVKEDRWAGWQLSLRRWVQRPEFAEFWLHYGDEYDAEFVKYMRDEYGVITEAWLALSTKANR
jgi:hypothetical protein